MTRIVAIAAMEAAAVLGVLWISMKRRRYRRRGAPLAASERASLAPFFDTSLLDAVRLCRVERIEPGLPPRLVRALGLPASVDISFAGGMAFVDAIVASRAAMEREDPESLLFHELIHCVQYRELGTYRFLRKYLRGWAAAGFDYFSIPLEEQAYALQDRFEGGEFFDAQAEVRAGLAALKYL